MAYTVDVDLNHAEIQRFLYTRTGPMVRNAERLGHRVQRVARRRVDSDSGKLAASIRVEVGTAPGFIWASVGTPLEYGIWHHEGTGVYAGRGYIRARRARVMRFKPGKTPKPMTSGYRPAAVDGRPYVYRERVKGQPPNRYLTSALWDVLGAFARIRSFSRRAGRR